MEEKTLYIQLYEYLLARIHFGLYPKEEPLPSIQKLGRQFNVSTIVVRGAYKMLEENGYIGERINKRPVVLYDPDDPRQRLPEKMFMDEDTLDEIHKSFDLIFPNVYYYGINLCDQTDIEKLHQILQRPLSAWDEPTSGFLAYLAGRHNNPLLMDLFYDVLLFCYPTYLAYLATDETRWQHVLRTQHNKLSMLLTMKSEGNQEGLLKVMSRAYPFGSPDILFDSNVRDTAYQWGKPQILLSAAGRIASMILDGVYPAGSYLPSAERMAEESSMSVITMRRTISLLNDLGILESHNGKGTQVLTPTQAAKKIKWSDPVIQNNVMLYLQALHILAIISHSLSISLFPLLDADKRVRLIEQMENSRKRGHAGAVITLCLQTLVYATHLPTLRVVFDKLFSLLIWGHPFLYVDPLLNLDSYIDRLIKSLNTKDVSSFSQTLRQTVNAIFHTSRAKALSVGIEAADTLVLPPI